METESIQWQCFQGLHFWSSSELTSVHSLWIILFSPILCPYVPTTPKYWSLILISHLRSNLYFSLLNSFTWCPALISNLVQVSISRTSPFVKRSSCTSVSFFSASVWASISTSSLNMPAGRLKLCVVLLPSPIASHHSSGPGTSTLEKSLAFTPGSLLSLPMSCFRPLPSFDWCIAMAEHVGSFCHQLLPTAVRLPWLPEAPSPQNKQAPAVILLKDLCRFSLSTFPTWY